MTDDKPIISDSIVPTIRELFLGLESGQHIEYASVAAAVDMRSSDPKFRCRVDTARKQLEREGLAVISCIRKVGYLRETGKQTLERTTKKSRPGIRRRAKRIGHQLAGVDLSNLSDQQKTEYFTERTVNNLVFVASGNKTRRRVLEVCKRHSDDSLPMADAIKTLQLANDSAATDDLEVKQK